MEFKWQALYDRNRHFSTLIWPQGIKWKFRILADHLQDMPNHILEYQLSTSEKSDKLYRKKEKSFFNPQLTPRDKMKIQKPYCTSTGHGQSSPTISLLFFLKCWWSLSEKTTLDNVIFRPLFDPRGQNENFKTLLHGRTELGNNNIPELSLESAGIMRNRHHTV